MPANRGGGQFPVPGDQYSIPQENRGREWLRHVGRAESGKDRGRGLHYLVAAPCSERQEWMEEFQQVAELVKLEKRVAKGKGKGTKPAEDRPRGPYRGRGMAHPHSADAGGSGLSHA